MKALGLDQPVVGNLGCLRDTVYIYRSKRVSDIIALRERIMILFGKLYKGLALKNNRTMIFRCRPPLESPPNPIGITHVIPFMTIHTPIVVHQKQFVDADRYPPTSKTPIEPFIGCGLLFLLFQYLTYNISFLQSNGGSKMPRSSAEGIAFQFSIFQGRADMWCVYDASLSGFPPLERFLVHSSICSPLRDRP